MMTDFIKNTKLTEYIHKNDPFAKFIDLEISKSEEQINEIIFHVPFNYKLIGNPSVPALHGGAVAGFAECIAIYHLVFANKLKKTPKLINFTVDYLRIGLSEDLFGQATILKMGRRVSLLNINVWQSNQEKPIITAIANIIIPE